MVFFGQLREPELYGWSAAPLALRDEGQEQPSQQQEDDDDHDFSYCEK